MLGAPGGDETTFAAVYLVAALAWAPAFYRAIDPWLRRRVGTLLRGHHRLAPRAGRPIPRCPSETPWSTSSAASACWRNVLGGTWPVTILAAATLALSLSAQLTLALVLATVAIWVLFRAGGRRLALAG